MVEEKMADYKMYRQIYPRKTHFDRLTWFFIFCSFLRITARLSKFLTLYQKLRKNLEKNYAKECDGTEKKKQWSQEWCNLL